MEEGVIFKGSVSDILEFLGVGVIFFIYVLYFYVEVIVILRLKILLECFFFVGRVFLLDGFFFGLFFFGDFFLLLFVISLVIFLLFWYSKEYLGRNIFFKCSNLGGV